MKKKLLLTALATGIFTTSAFADEYIKNDLRTLFLNNEAIII